MEDGGQAWHLGTCPGKTQLNTENTQYDGFDVLSSVITFDADGRAVWPAEDLQAMLHHLMRAPLDVTLSTDPYQQYAIATLAETSAPAPRTFEELFHHPRPALELLRILKSFAKRSRGNPRSTLAPEVCLLLYYVAIALALVRHGQRITRLTEDELRNGLSWLTRQPWVDPLSRNLGTEALAYLRTGRHLWRRG
jgi:hypothetical protein